MHAWECFCTFLLLCRCNKNVHFFLFTSLSLTIGFLHTFSVGVDWRWRSDYSQTPVTLVRHFRPTVRADRFRFPSVLRMRLLPRRRRAIVSGDPQAVRNAAKRRGVHFRLFLLDGRMSPFDGRHGHRVEHVILLGAQKVVRHAARRRRVHGHVSVDVVSVAVHGLSHARFLGLALFVHRGLSGQAVAAELGGRLRSEIKRYSRRWRVVHATAALARGRRRPAAVVLLLDTVGYRQTVAVVDWHRWHGPLFPSAVRRHRPGPRRAGAALYAQTVRGPWRWAPTSAATRVNGCGKLVARGRQPRWRRPAPTAAGPLGRGQTAGRQVQATGISAVAAASCTWRGRTTRSRRRSTFGAYNIYVIQ